MERKPFLLRLDPATMTALRVWAGDDLRSLNGQIEFLLRRALREAGRLPRAAKGDEAAEALDALESLEARGSEAQDPSSGPPVGARIAGEDR